MRSIGVLVEGLRPQAAYGRLLRKERRKGLHHPASTLTPPTDVTRPRCSPWRTPWLERWLPLAPHSVAEFLQGAVEETALVSGVPRFHDDIVQFIAQEILDHTLVVRLDFQEVGQYSGGSKAALHDA